MNTYIATGKDIGELEEKLAEHNVQTERFKHFDVLAIHTEQDYESIQQLCPEYHIHPQTTYDTTKY